jgi:lysozyme
MKLKSLAMLLIVIADIFLMSKYPTKVETNTLPVGIDVSHFQGTVNWNQVADAGVNFVFIKASQGNHEVDSQYRRNWRETAAHGLPRGVYHYLDPSIDPSLQAEHFLKTTAGEFGSFPPVVDIEAFEGRDAAEVKRALRRFIDVIEKHFACKPIIYTSPDFWDELHDSDFDSYELWLADYAKKPKLPDGWRKWTIWQFESDGVIEGINGRVDKSLFHGSREKLVRMSCEKHRSLAIAVQ